MPILMVHGERRVSERSRMRIKEFVWEMEILMRVENLFGLFAEEGDEVVTILGLLETTEGHLGAGNVFLGVF